MTFHRFSLVYHRLFPFLYLKVKKEINLHWPGYLTKLCFLSVEAARLIEGETEEMEGVVEGEDGEKCE